MVCGLPDRGPSPILVHRSHQHVGFPTSVSLPSSSRLATRTPVRLLDAFGLLPVAVEESPHYDLAKCMDGRDVEKLFRRLQAFVP